MATANRPTLIALIAAIAAALAGCGGGGGQTRTYEMPSSSMEPTIHCARPGSLCEANYADRVVAKEPPDGIERGDIVVLIVPPIAERACGAGGTYIKRVVGLPGETWSEKDGYVYIDGEKLDEPYVKPERRDFNSWPARKIASDNYFVMGDNRQSSCDSRRFGTVPESKVVGKVVKIESD